MVRRSSPGSPVQGASPPRLALGPVVKAGVASFLLVFGIGFALGTVRTLWLVPQFGALVAVLIELPFMLAAGWLVTQRCIAHWQVPARMADRVIMGSIAFDLLIAAELVLGLALLGQSVGDWLGALITPAGLIGLAAQMLYGAMPALAMRVTGR